MLSVSFQLYICQFRLTITIHKYTITHLVTILSAAIILAFTTIEFLDYRRVNVETSIVVDKSRGERLTVNMNVTFPKVPCYCTFRHITLPDKLKLALNLNSIKPGCHGY